MNEKLNFRDKTDTLKSLFFKHMINFSIYFVELAQID